MLQNYLSTSGTAQGVQGNDAKAPAAYWEQYTYHPVTSGELSGLINGDIYSTALSLSAGEYTCLEISFDEPVYVGQFRCYLSGSAEVALSYPHLTENPSKGYVTVESGAFSRENVQGQALYYDRIDSSRGYVEGEAIPLTVNEYVQLISATYLTTASGSPSVVQSGFENKTIKQIVEPEDQGSVFTRVSLQAGASPVNLDKVSIAPVDVYEGSFDFSSDTQDDDRRDELRWWYADQADRGHFEGRVVTLDEGAVISGTWDQQVTWSGGGSREERSDLGGYTVRQIIPASELSYTGDGVRVTLRGGSEDIKVNYASFMPSNSTEFKLEFGSSADIYRENLKHDIEQWHNDGSDGGSWEAELSRYYGHFESYEVDVDNSAAIMYSENVIGIPATSHGLKAGDYIRIEGTTFYDGYYFILTYSTPHIIVIWGIYDPEVFTSSAKIRRVVTLGTEYDDYGVKPDCRGVVPFVEVNFVTGDKAYILSYEDSGKLHNSVLMGPEEIQTGVVASIYDVTIDGGWLCNSPGPAVTPDFRQSIPDQRGVAKEANTNDPTGSPDDAVVAKVNSLYRLRVPDSELPEGRWPDRYYYDDTKAIADIGHYEGGYGWKPGGLWKGSMSCISESQDPSYEGDKTGWGGVPMLFDRKMAQPLWTLISLADCPWITMCYRGPIPVKFILDLGEQRVLSKYRYWIQTLICHFADQIPPSYPKSWKVEASNHGDNEQDWVLLDQEVDYSLSNFVPSTNPPDERAFGCAEGEWKSYRNLEPYRYYRFNIYESWTCFENIGNYECAHIDEIDFVEHSCTAGIFPTIIETPLYMDSIGKIIPDEHLRLGSQIFYALSFDDAQTFEVYLPKVDYWRTIVKYEDSKWQYFDGLIWREMDSDKPQENTIRFALWHAFSVYDNRMDAETLQSIPESVYSARMPSGGYVKFAVGLTSSSRMEAMLKGITVSGTVFNPTGFDAPTELTFSGGQSGCIVPAYGTITSDWINDDLPNERDALFVMDLDTTASSVPYYDYTEGYKYFYRRYSISYDLQSVDVNYYTLASGVVMLDSVEVRQSDTVTLPASTHNFPIGAYIRVSGTYQSYDGFHYVERQRAGSFDVKSKHWTLDTPVPSGAFAQRRYSIGPGNMQPHAQVGSILKFKGTGQYTDYESAETSNYSYYYVYSNVAMPGWEAANLFDSDANAQFHSGRPIKYGPVVVGLRLSEPAVFDRYRLRAASNDFYWELEYPSSVTLDGSNESDPSLTNDSHWVSICSGIAAVPIGPNRFSDWNVGSNSVAYSHYRFNITSSIGGVGNCIRLAQAEVTSISGNTLNGITSVEVAPGFSGNYLLDDSYSEYAVVSSGSPSLHLDLLGKKRNISRFRFRCPRESLSVVGSTYSPSAVFPKALLLFGSNKENASTDSEEDWEGIEAFDYGEEAPSDGAWAGWLTVSSGIDYDPYRYYKIQFLSNMEGGGNLTEEYTIDLTESFPYKVFTLPAGSTLYSLQVTVNAIAGGGYLDHYRDLDPHSGDYARNLYKFISWYEGAQLENNRYITQIGGCFNEDSLVRFQYAKPLGNDRFDVFDLTPYFSVGADYNGSPAWLSINPVKIPLVGVFYLGAYGNLDIGLTYSPTVKLWYSNNWVSGENILYSLSEGQALNLDVRYGNYYHVRDDSDDKRFISYFQPYGSGEQQTWTGVYGPFPEDREIKIYRDSIGADTQGEIKVSITRTLVSSSEIVIRAAELEVDLSDTMKSVSYIDTQSSLPYELLQLPPWHSLSVASVTTLEGFAGGYAEQAGYVASGTYGNSFWTIVDRHWQLQNSRAISRVGVYSDTSVDIDFKLFKVRSGTEWFDISEIETVTHSGTGFEWFTLTSPHLIPDNGTYHLGWWQPNSSVKMADSTGSGYVSYEYGGHTGTNIHLPLSHLSMRPCLAVKYASAFTIGMDSTDDVMPTFSPSLGGRVNTASLELGPYTEAKSIYLYQDCTMVSGDTSGQIRVDLMYLDTVSEDYGLTDFSILDSGHLLHTRHSDLAFDSSRTTGWHSYFVKEDSDKVFLIMRSDSPIRLSAFRYRPVTGESASFPNGIEVQVSNSYQGNLASLGVSGESVYDDEAYFMGAAPGSWGPWVYIDSYLEKYRYFIFSFFHPDTATAEVVSVGDIELKVEYDQPFVVNVSEIHNTIRGITDEGMDDTDVRTMWRAGDAREIDSIYDTFSSYGKNELSPGTYFYRGENTPSTLNPKPSSIVKTEDSEYVDVDITHPFFAGMDILAWHRLDEQEGDYSDSSGNGVTATRIGNISTTTGRFKTIAASIEDDSSGGNIVFTLPHHLEEYTVSFWYSPGHNIYNTYQTEFDIMGGWVSYGAIPGVWHISMSMHRNYKQDPYPPEQTHTIEEIGSYGVYGRMVFGNYGARVETSRNAWKAGTWYHIAFAFRPNASTSKPYKCWINGVPDESAHFYGYDSGSSVYPPTDVIMVDPNDIHYTRHNKQNCMYFGLPLEDGAGSLYEHSLQNVMHFKKILSDEDVFKLFRMKPTLSDEWDGIYFPDTEMVESPGRIIIDLGSPKVVTKYGLIVPSGSVDDVWWRFTGSGTGGNVTLDERYAEFESLPDYHNILNPDAYQHYVIEFLGSSDKADYLFLNGLRMVDVPHMPTVSGTYETVTSGLLSQQTLLEMSAEVYTPEESQINFSISRDQGQTWWAMVSGTWTLSGTMTYDEFFSMDKCDFDLLGSGTLYTRHEFTSDPILMYPAVSGIETRQTDWGTTASALEFTITGTIGANQTNTSEWLRYAQGQSTRHLLFLEFSSSGGNPSYSENGSGHIIDSTYTCSGLYLLSELEGRKDDLVSIKASSVAELEHDNLVGLQGAGPYNGYWVVGSGFTSDLWVYAPYEPYQVQAGAEYRRVIPEALNAGSELVTSSGVVYVITSSGNVVTLSEDVERQEIQAVYDSMETEGWLHPTREVIANQLAGTGTDVITLDLTSNSTPSPYVVFESTEDSNLYKLFDGNLDESKGVTRVAVDLGGEYLINSYRWYYEYTTVTGTPPDYWEVYVANTLPYWELASTEVAVDVENGSWSDNYSLSTTSGHRYYLFKFYEEVSLREIQLLRKNIMPSTDSCITLFSGWEFDRVGRVSEVAVHSVEPDTTHIFHGVTFDGGNSYCVFDDNAWESVVQLNGSTWQYKDTSWQNSSENTVYGAFRDAVEEASQLFSTAQLESIKEMDWHGSGAVESISGSLGFIQYMYNNGLYTPTFSGYEISYQTLPSGINTLIPEGFSYGETETSGSYSVKTFSYENLKEMWYDRKLIQDLRVYVTNSGVTSSDVREVAVLDVQEPNDDYYLDPIQGVMHNNEGDHLHTGGILLNEGESAEISLPQIPAEKKIYYAEAKIYFEPELGPPSGIEVSRWRQYHDYLSSFIWSDVPFDEFSVGVYNDNAAGEGPLRVYAMTLNAATYSGAWNVEDNFNLIESAYTSNLTSVSGIPTLSGSNIQQLSTPHMERLVDTSLSSLPLLPGKTIALSSQLYEFGGKSQEARVYVDTYSGVEVYFRTQVSGAEEWSEYFPGVWNGTSFSHIFYGPTNVTTLETVIGNFGSHSVIADGMTDAAYSDIRWLRALQLINCSDEIAFGTTATGVAELELPTYYTDYNKIFIYNNNKSGTPANARVLPRFSGNYHLDRNIRVSEDVVHWYTVEDGVRMPEDYPWEMGKFENTRVSEDEIVLEDDATVGTWRSPVIEVLDPSSTAAYIYVKNINYDQSYVTEDYQSINNIVKVRTSETKPMHVFLVTAVNSDNELLVQAPWKISHFRSDGTIIKTLMEPNYHPVYCRLHTGALDINSEPYAPRRYWTSTEPYLWQFYGALDSRGYAGVTLGLQWAGRHDSSIDDAYKFYRGFPSNTGQTFPRSTWGYPTSEIHIFDSNWLWLPIFNRSLRYVDKKEGGIFKKCWQMVDVVYRPEPFYELYQEKYFSDKKFHARNIYHFPGAANTPEYNTEIDYLYSFEGTLADLENDGIRCAACPDNIIHENEGHYYWLHYACNYDVVYYKTLLVNGQSVEKGFDNIERKFNFMVEAGEGSPTRGFWGITQEGVYWYKYDGSSLTEEFGVTADNTDNFRRIHHGCTDFMNNLWFIDLPTERVIRVNYRTQKVDYSRVVQGASSVACDPFDGSAYIYVVRPPEFSNGDAIKMVHIGDYDYLEPEVVCKAPGVSMLDSFNINLISRSTTPAGYYDVIPEDPLWGEGEGSIPWINYSAAAPILPKGMYKQFKLTLRREDLEAASPEVEYLRIPVPAIINKIPWKGYKDIFVDTIPRSQNYDLTAGTHTLDLLVWWTRE